MLREELLRRGYKFEQANMARRYGKFTAPNGASWLTHTGMLAYPFVSQIAHRIGKSKLISGDFARLYDLHVPATLVASDDTATQLAFLKEHGSRLVVKPHNGYGSHGLTLGVSTAEEMTQAIRHAQKYSQQVLLQEFAEGEEVRLTIMNGKTVSSIHRETPRLIGDGVSTIVQLLEAENRDRAGQPVEILPYPQLAEPLISTDGLDMAAVPGRGHIVRLGTSSLVSGGASLYDITDTIDPSYTVLAERLAEAISPSFLVVDLLIKDYRVPATDDSYVFLECNTSPSLRLYYGIRGGGGYDIVPQLADLIDESLMGNHNHAKEPQND
jgi:D-alanine-D-alanine ligase-like ATP-grasp enzyme